MPTLKSAALQLAKQGFKIFPVPPGTKKSYIGKSNVTFGSGENWGMTDDPSLIEKYWDRWSRANIGLPTGAVNGIIVIETDTKAGHSKLAVDGETTLRALEKRLGKLPKVRMARSPSGSRHRFFAHPGFKHRVAGGAGKLGPGVDVCADGQMVVVPPSIRSDGVYRWLNKLPIEQPLPASWLREIGELQPVAAKIKPDSSNPYAMYGAEEDEDPPTLEEVKESLDGIDNSSLNWDQWNSVGMRLYAFWRSSELEEKVVFALWDEWSAQAENYNRRRTAQKWRLFHRSPPERYGSWAIVHLVKYGWPAADDGEPATDEEEGEQEEVASESAAGSDDVNGAKHALGASGIVLDEQPVDFWGKFAVPELPNGLLPPIIERFARVLGELQGSDPASLAMGALTCCGVATPDCYRVQPKHFDASWTEAPRIWVAVVGSVSVMKSPIVSCIIDPIKKIDHRLTMTYQKELREYEALSKEERDGVEEPHPISILLEDTTSQGAQNALRWSKDGMLCCRDELSGFFGGLDQYGRGDFGVERPFWLQAFNGGSYKVTRADRNRTFLIENLSVSFFGGVQPDVISRLNDVRVNDGLIQRLFPILAKDSEPEKDIPLPPVAIEYEELISRLYDLPRDRSSIFKFTPEALVIRQKLSDYNLLLMKTLSNRSRRLAEHVGKYRGLFARLCLIWHIVEHHESSWIGEIDVSIAQRVAKFMYNYLLPHAIAFYTKMLNVSDDNDRMTSIAGYILAHEKTRLTNRDVQRSIRSMRGLKRREIEDTMSQMEACHWVMRKVNLRQDSVDWVVNPEVHQLYLEQAAEERRERARFIELMRYENRKMDEI